MKLLLTGQLPFILLLATLLALPISFGLLHLYRRAVVRSMRASGNSSGIAAEPSRQTLPPEDRSGARPTAASLETALVRGPWHTAGIYAIAGLAYAAVIVTGVLLSAGFEFFPMRVLFLIVSFAWPIVLTVNLVAGTVPRARMWALAGYFGVLGCITAVAVVRSPTFTVGQALLFWSITNIPPTLAVWIVLARPVRAVGPFVLSFMVIATAGANVALSAAGADDRGLRQIVVAGQAVGLGGTGIFIALIAIGALVFGFGGWLALQWIGARYQAKRISDQSIAQDAIWLFFGIAHSVGLAFEGPRGF